MYDAYSHHDEPYSGQEDEDRVRHLVFLDGLLVDTYTETAGYSPYACLALELDAARRAVPAPSPPAPAHERVLAWLDAMVGGRRALLDLDDEPLSERTDGVAADHPPYDAAVDLLERTARDVFRDDEVGVAARGLLDRVWTEDPDLLTVRRTVPQVAGGVLWLVGRANGLFGQAPAVRQKDVQRTLWLSQPLSTAGRSVERCVQPLGLDRPARPSGVPPLEPCGDARLLTSTTRRELVRWRERALEAERRHHADQEASRVLPPEVES